MEDCCARAISYQLQTGILHTTIRRKDCKPALEGQFLLRIILPFEPRMTTVLFCLRFRVSCMCSQEVIWPWCHQCIFYMLFFLFFPFFFLVCVCVYAGSQTLFQYPSSIIYNRSAASIDAYYSYCPTHTRVPYSALGPRRQRHNALLSLIMGTQDYIVKM